VDQFNRAGNKVRERVGLLFADGSMLLLPEGTTVATAKTEAEEHDLGDPEAKTQVLSVIVTVVQLH
jgi:hypothetical protein